MLRVEVDLTSGEDAGGEIAGGVQHAPSFAGDAMVEPSAGIGRQSENVPALAVVRPWAGSSHRRDPT